MPRALCFVRRSVSTRQRGLRLFENATNSAWKGSRAAAFNGNPDSPLSLYITSDSRRLQWRREGLGDAAWFKRIAPRSHFGALDNDG